MAGTDIAGLVAPLISLKACQLGLSTSTATLDWDDVLQVTSGTESSSRHLYRIVHQCSGLPQHAADSLREALLTCLQYLNLEPRISLFEDLVCGAGQWLPDYSAKVLQAKLAIKQMPYISKLLSCYEKSAISLHVIY